MAAKTAKHAQPPELRLGTMLIASCFIAHESSRPITGPLTSEVNTHVKSERGHELHAVKSSWKQLLIMGLLFASFASLR